MTYKRPHVADHFFDDYILQPAPGWGMGPLPPVSTTVDSPPKIINSLLVALKCMFYSLFEIQKRRLAF